jgi:DNA-binding transcriptional ArsR family regulator
MLVTHISVVGHNKEKIIDSIKRYPVSRVVLLTEKDEESVKDVAKEIEKEIRGFVETEIVEVEKENIIESTLKIIQLINEEKERGRDIKLNIADSIDNLGVACYLAALITGVEIYSGISKVEEGRIVGVSEVYNIPLLPIKDVGEERVKILKILYESEINSMDEIIYKLNPDVKEKELLGERARISYHIKMLRTDGFVESQRVGKNVRLKITKLGEIYLKGKRLI